MKTLIFVVVLFTICICDNLWAIDDGLRLCDTVKFSTAEFKPHLTCEQRGIDYRGSISEYPILRINNFKNDTTYTVENKEGEYLIIRKYEVIDTLKVKIKK